jgi:hypothetical protein
MKSLFQRLRSVLRYYPWSAFVAAWLTFLAGEWTAAGLKGDELFTGWVFVRDWVPAVKDHPWIPIAFVGVLFVGSFIWLYHIRGAFFPARTLSRRLAEPRASLILLVSPQNAEPLSFSVTFPLLIRKGAAQALLGGKDLKNDIESLGADLRWNWQQLLRAVQPHISKLRRIHLIGSPGPKGSFPQLPLCKALLEHYLPHVTIRPSSEPVDFEDFDALAECVSQIIQEEKAGGSKERDIIIDVTGGVKTASIAAASVTLNNQVTFQYVQTNPPYEVYAYDVINMPPPSHEK